jgi:hypothetical protein
VPPPAGSVGGMKPVIRDRATRGQSRDGAVNPRERRRLVSWLRLTASRTQPSHPVCRRRELLLYDRVAGVRGDLLELAALLEQADDPDPACVSELRRLLRDGCQSPLYNRDVHTSELRATLYYTKQAIAERRGASQ